MLVKFRSTLPYTGFMAAFKAVDALPATPLTCSWGHKRFDTTGSSGILASYDFPSKYPNNAECSWSIKVSPLQRVQLSLDFFQLQPSENCSADYLEVSSGARYGIHKLIARLCGNRSSHVVFSAAQSMFVKFKSDFAGRYPGFKATFKAVTNYRK